MLAKNAAGFDSVVDQYPTISIQNAKRGKRTSKGALQVKITQGSQKCPDSGENSFHLGTTKHNWFTSYLKNGLQTNMQES